MSSDEGRPSPRIKPVRLAIVLSVVALVVYAAQFGDAAGPEKLPSGLISLDLSDQPKLAKLQFKEQTSLQIWAVIDMSHPERSPREDLTEFPQALEYVIDIDGTATAELRCNPFNASYFNTYHADNSVGRPWGQQYDGRMKGCAVTLPAGEYTFTMHVETKINDAAQFVFRRHAIVVRER